MSKFTVQYTAFGSTTRMKSMPEDAAKRVVADMKAIGVEAEMLPAGQSTAPLSTVVERYYGAAKVA